MPVKHAPIFVTTRPLQEAGILRIAVLESPPVIGGPFNRHPHRSDAGMQNTWRPDERKGVGDDTG
ncbi:hypothetical protein EBZ35_06010 [bacterium]|nr:hypothetical protein [bacterium]